MASPISYPMAERNSRAKKKYLKPDFIFQAPRPNRIKAKMEIIRVTVEGKSDLTVPYITEW